MIYIFLIIICLEFIIFFINFQKKQKIVIHTIKFYSDFLINENIGVFIEYLLNLCNFRVIKYVIFIVSINNAPIMTSLHTSLMNNWAKKSILFSVKCLYLVVQNRICIFYFLLIHCFESIQMNYKCFREWLYM